VKSIQEEASLQLLKFDLPLVEHEQAIDGETSRLSASNSFSQASTWRGMKLDHPRAPNIQIFLQNPFQTE
jgi:hypothetical protein